MLIPFGILSAAGIGSDYELIESQILGSTAASITFSSLATYSGVYKHLQIRMTARMTGSSGFAHSLVRFNADTGNNYAHHRLGGYGSNPVESGASTSQNHIYAGSIMTSNQAASSFSGSVIDILDPFSTSKNTTVRSLQGAPGGTNNNIELRSGAWFNTASVTTISLTPVSDNYSIGSRFSLYGIKG
jgi:hypothetical protein